MLSRGVSGALRLHKGCAAVASHIGKGSSSNGKGDTFAGTAVNAWTSYTNAFQQHLSVAGSASIHTSQPRQESHWTSGSSRSTADAPSAVQYLQQALGIAAEHALVSRLAAVWGVPSEILQANVQALADLLQPCGRDTYAHALWVMVRCPELRHASEQQLKSSIRQLNHLIRHLDLDKPSLLAAVYKRPWVLSAATAAPAPAAERASATPVASATSSTSTSSSSSNLTSWKRELALMMLEMQASDAPRSSSSSKSGSSDVSASPTLALAAVKSYLAVAQAAHHVKSAAAALTRRRNTSPQQQRTQQQQQVRKQGSQQEEQRQQQVQQELLLQLLTVCPMLDVLPPEVLVTRWQLLLAGLQGRQESAEALLRTSPYILLNYTDCPSTTEVPEAVY